MRCYFNSEPSPGHGQLALILSYFHKEQPDNLLRFFFSGITTAIFSWSWNPLLRSLGDVDYLPPCLLAGIFPSQWSFDSGYLPKPLFFFFSPPVEDLIDQNENQSPTIPQLKDKHLIFIIFPKYIYFWQTKIGHYLPSSMKSVFFMKQYGMNILPCQWIYTNTNFKWLQGILVVIELP